MKKPSRFNFDLLVIGSGPGGEVGAYLTAKTGKKVAMVEMDTPGGECPNFGCVPTKALLYAADTYRKSKKGNFFGIHAEPRLDYKELKKWKDLAVLRTGTSQASELYKAEGIHAIRGRAEFVSPWAVKVRGKIITAKNFLIATGSSSFVPPIKGLKESGYITYRDAIDLKKLPKSVFVIGGGAIGCEFTELFSTFGSKVSVAEMAPHLIPAEDEDVGKFVGDNFEQKGINVFTGARVVKVEKSGRKKVVYLKQDGKTHQAKVDVVMIASGMAPNVDMGLEEAGVKYSRRGVEADKHMQTSVKHIYTAGDVTGPYGFTHMATYQGRVIAHNLEHPRKKQTVDYTAVPRCVFLDPEIATVGATEKVLKEKGKDYLTATSPVSFLGRANTSDQTEGFVKVISDLKGRLLGASVVNPRAGEVMHELALAIRHKMTAHDISETIHAYPTWSEAVRHACNKLALKIK